MVLRAGDDAPDRSISGPRAGLTDEIRAYLERRHEALSHEIRHYPTPIARCDVQLGGLLEARAEIVQLLERGDGEALVAGFIAAAERWDDAEAQRLCVAAQRGRAGSS